MSSLFFEATQRLLGGRGTLLALAAWYGICKGGFGTGLASPKIL